MFAQKRREQDSHSRLWGLQFLQPQNSTVAPLSPWDSAQPETGKIEGPTDQLHPQVVEC